MSQDQNEYILGTGADELSRLGIQHRVWADATTTIWRKSGVGPGTKVLDVGSGPGHATLDMAQLVTDTGSIVAIDESRTFVDHLNAQAQLRGLQQIEARVGDAENMGSALKPNEKFDVIYCRWVLCWLKNPQNAVAEMRKALKPGGRLIIHDYFNWYTMTIAPRTPAVSRMVDAAIQSFHAGGGDIDISARLPNLLRAVGLRLHHFEVHQRVARGGGIDSTLAWPLTWWRSYGPKLVHMDYLSATDCEQALKDLNALESDPDQFFVCPPLFEFVATAD